jgi:hypothetical protein
LAVAKHRSIVLAIVLVSSLSAAGCSRGSEPAGSEPATSFDRRTDCFTAVADGELPAQAVFDEAGRTGNGETWSTILRRVLERDATIGDVNRVEAMGFGIQYDVTYQGRRSWFGHDAEAGGAVFCTPDRALFALLEQTYQRARSDPELLRRLIRDVPASAWND